jgi:hypothetical protein
MFAQQQQHAFSDRFELVNAYRDGVQQFIEHHGVPEDVISVMTDSYVALAKACVMTADGLHKCADAINFAAQNVDYAEEWYMAQQQLSLMADRVQVSLATINSCFIPAHQGTTQQGWHVLVSSTEGMQVT